jgi:hypothetical protein
LTHRLGTGSTGSPSAAAYAPNTPWWFYTRQDRPGAPDAPPQGSAAARDAGWWGKYTDQDAGEYSYVRSFWRAKPKPKPPAPPMAPAGESAMPGAVAAAQAIGSSNYPEWVLKVAAQTGEPVGDIAAAFGVKGAGGRAAAGGAAGGGRGGKPPWWSAFTNASPDPPGGGDPGRGARGEPWWGKYMRSAGQTVPPAPPPRAGSTPWELTRTRHPWHWQTTRRVGAFARRLGGKRAGNMAMAGMTAAAQRFAFSGSMTSAARVGVMGAAAAGGPLAVGVVGLGIAAVKAAEALNRMTTEQLSYNRELSKSSASMALVFAQRDVQEHFRQREVGDRLAASARRLTGAEQFKEEYGTKELGILWERTKNDLAAAWEVFKTGLFFELNQSASLLNRIMEWLDGRGSDEVLAFGDFIRDLQKQDMEARKRKDVRFEPPKFGRRPG